MILLGPWIGFESKRLMRALSFISLGLLFTAMCHVAIVLVTLVDFSMLVLLPKSPGPHLIFSCCPSVVY
jgi:hypothetical protein